MSKRLLFFFLLGFLVFSTASIVKAQQKATSNCVETKIGDPKGNENAPPGCGQGLQQGPTSQPGQNPPSGPTSCGEAPSANYQSPDQYATAVKDKWGITFVGMSLDQMQMIWQAFHKIDCTGILQDIRGAYISAWDNNYSQQFSCPQDGGVNLYIGNHHGDFLRALITHEITHIWQFCSTRGEANLLQIPDAYTREGGLTNYSRTGCGFSVNLHNEDHADTIGLYLHQDTGELTCGGGRPNPFIGGGYPSHRNVAENGTRK